MKPGDLVNVLCSRDFGNKATIGMILEYENNDPVDLITVKVIVMGRVIRVGKEYIEKLKNNARAS
tara:strand:- start:499 stop:693 length:195 start_codon:yes stop_codon:yes gene_type:complete